MIRRVSILLAAVTFVGLACAGPDATAPSRFATPGQAASKNWQGPPGSVGAPSIINNGSGLKGCTPRDAQYGTAVIGPSGGELDVGPNRLIIPPGALTQTMQVSGRVPANAATPTIYFEPTGLQFKKSAGLILDASNCTDVPAVVYLNDLEVPSPPIPAVYSTWWHTIAVPIDHFSGYAVAF
jgi:hypothetical protein